MDRFGACPRSRSPPCTAMPWRRIHARPRPGPSRRGGVRAFGFPEVGLGSTRATASRASSTSWAAARADLLLTGRMVAAPEARSIRLVSKACRRRAQERVSPLAQQIARHPRPGLAASKSAVADPAGRASGEAQARVGGAGRSRDPRPGRGFHRRNDQTGQGSPPLPRPSTPLRRERDP